MRTALVIGRRVAVVVAVAAAIVLTVPGSAAAAGFETAPCPPQVVAGVRAALNAATDIKCRVRVDPAVGIDAVKADVAFPDGRLATLDVTPAGKVESITYGHTDLVGSSGKGMALLFWAFALASVVGALFVITRRNLIAAVMGMVGSFIGIAAIYMMLYAQFLAVIQMLVYAGAIMVLFVFVVMILNRPEDEPVAPSGRAGQALGGLAIIYLIWRLCSMLVHVEPPNPDVAMNAPPALPEQCVEWKRDETVPRNKGEPAPEICVRSERPDWGSIAAVGTDLFGPGVFPFEAISILLLVAVVGAFAFARPLRPGADGAEADGDDAKHPEGGHG
jgi:NADH-quinone oxidoreductase subunit J